MMRKGRVALFFSPLVLVLALGTVYHDWAGYVFHLAKHQLGAVTGRQKISAEWIDTQPEERREALRGILQVKEFGKKLYGLGESKSFDSYVDLKRGALGWNLTAAPELELRAVEFGFPIAGKFGYLGFFDEALKNKWKETFLRQGYDVYENEIGAYSTLGYFQDPVFSTYLSLSKQQLVRMILHEMAHEALYFKNDSDFSESLASFIERPAANMYLYGTASPPQEIVSRHELARQEYGQWMSWIENARQGLEKIYSSTEPRDEKVRQKARVYDELFKKIKSANFIHFHGLDEMERSELNNAFLVQTHRYSPSHKNGFSLLLSECDNNFQCWFAGLKKLEICPKETRQKFAGEEVSLSETLKTCL